jgi:CheY-like chemotaxis protein
MQRSILIIEDDVDIRESLQEFLEGEGHEVHAAGNGEQAFQMLRKSQGASGKAAPIDLILLDLMMPVMNGVEFRRKQVEDPKLSRIPVIVISADNRTQSIASSLGLQWCIQKPMNLEELLKALDQAGHEEVHASPLKTAAPRPAADAEAAWKP